MNISRKRSVYMKKRIRVISCFCMISVCLTFTACETKEKDQPSEITGQAVPEETISSGVEEENMEQENSVDDLHIPSKEEVLAMREIVLEGMSEEEIGRLTENIKTANLQMESAYLNDNIFDKLADKDSLYWQYFDQKGDIQIGWWYNGSICDKDVIMRAEGLTEEQFYEEYEPGIVYNRFDAANFVELIEDMQKSVQHEMLIADLQQLIDLTNLAAETHEMEYANDIYKILHDLDYFLLRYGIEDVGKYTQDGGAVAEYYGVLNVYGETPLLLQAEDPYHLLTTDAVENDYTKYGDIQQEHQDFISQTGDITFYYDMECFYFDESYPEVLNETLQDYYASVKEAYCQDAEVYDEGTAEDQNPPYDSLIFQYFTYVGEDYVSLVYNNVSYMGGAHPYSSLDGITINCSTGELVEVYDFIHESEAEIGEQLKKVLDIDYYEANEWDYYITEDSVVFFYYDPGFWDCVETKRVK